MADDACSPRTKTRAIRSDENYMICNGGGRGRGADVHTIAAAGCSDGNPRPVYSGSHGVLHGTKDAMHGGHWEMGLP